MRPKYTIFIPAYNADKYLLNICNNILRQKEKPDQVIIVDDTKNSKSFFEKISIFFKKKKIEINFLFIRNNINLKPPRSWNRNYNSIKNEIVFRLDVDDYWLENHTSKMIDEYLKNDGFVIYAQKSKKNFFQSLFHNEDFVFVNQINHSSIMINLNVCKIIYPVTDLPYDDLLLYIKLKYIKKLKIKYVNFNTSIVNIDNYDRWSTRGYKNLNEKYLKKFFFLSLKKKLKINKISFMVFLKILIHYKFLKAIYIFYKILK